MKQPSKANRSSDYRFDLREIPQLFLRPELSRSANSIVVSDGIFDIEKVFRTGGKVRQATLPLYDARRLKYDLKVIRDLLHDLLTFVLTEDVSIRFSSATRESTDRAEHSSFSHSRNICLFSGGVDSYSGILLAKQKLKDVTGIFCAHSDQARMIHIVHEIDRKILKKANIDLHKLRVPSVGSHGYAQLRGFLYVVGAAAWMNLLQADKLLITECGPTMYQPRFSPLDSITMTTHPVVLRYASLVTKLLLQKNVKIATPFENLTKAEVIAICPQKSGLRYTHSCISQRFGRHDGTCYGCVIRRLASIAAGVDDVRYDKNPIADKHAKAGNLMSLLAYSYDLLVNYHGMESFEIESIETYSKQDLFRRFALDNFAAIHRLIRSNHRVRPSIFRMYKSLIQKIGNDRLSARLESLRKGRFLPVF